MINQYSKLKAQHRVKKLLLVMAVFIFYVTACADDSNKAAKPPEYIAAKSVRGPAKPIVNWPYTITDNHYKVTLYEPQIVSWKKYQHLTAWLAISVENLDALPSQSHKTVFGSVQVEADTEVEFNSRKVYLAQPKVTAVRFSELQGKRLKDVIGHVKTLLEKFTRPVNLDLMLASLADTRSEARGVEVNVTPPKIYYRAIPSVLLQIDGKPLESPIKGVDDLKFIVNTNWDLFKVATDGRFYLLYKDHWLMSNELFGPWEATDQTAPLSQLPKTASWQDVHQALPAKAWPGGSVPEVITSTAPAELIVTDGKPRLVVIEDTGLSYVENSDSDLFRDTKNGTWYYLVTGRWFSSDQLTGPWKFATTSLPQQFAAIPPDHVKADVLAMVPGTMEAAVAVIQSQIPTKAVISRGKSGVEVTYAGEPKFEKISGTTLYYGVNTSYDIIRYKQQYYLCYQGIWFVGSVPDGTYIVAATIPAEIYDIPANHPLYHVTYVVIYSATATEVTTGYSSGYHHHYVHYGIVVWGSGWYYPPYYYYYGPYPVYYHYPYTYGIAAAYNPNTGTYARRGTVYGPYGGMSRAAVYNPKTGSYARGAAVWDSNEAYGVGHAYNPRTGTSAYTRQYSSDYERWGQSVVRRGDEWATVRKYGNEQGTVRQIETSKEGKVTSVQRGDQHTTIGRSAEGDIYAGRDGQVYKRDDNGWQKRVDGGWSSVDQAKIDARKSQVTEQSAAARSRMQSGSPATGTMRSGISSDTRFSLSQDARARQYGARRSQQFNRGSFNRGSFSRRGGRRR